MHFQIHSGDVNRTLSPSEISRVVGHGAGKYPDALIWCEVIAVGEIRRNVRFPSQRL